MKGMYSERSTVQTPSLNPNSKTAKLDSITRIIRPSAIRGGKKDQQISAIPFAAPQFPYTRTVITVF